MAPNLPRVPTCILILVVSDNMCVVASVSSRNRRIPLRSPLVQLDAIMVGSVGYRSIPPTREVEVDEEQYESVHDECDAT